MDNKPPVDKARNRYSLEVAGHTGAHTGRILDMGEMVHSPDNLPVEAGSSAPVLVVVAAWEMMFAPVSNQVFVPAVPEMLLENVSSSHREVDMFVLALASVPGILEKRDKAHSPVETEELLMEKMATRPSRVLDA